jgi:L-threonylcarbamoyladenylate synthase
MSYKQTNHWIVDNNQHINKNSNEIKEAALWIKKGELVALPTETVYGLGANALSDEAVQKIFIAKGRPSDNPLIVHISRKEQLLRLVSHIPDSANLLINAFWPGPLTIIFPKGEEVSTVVTAGLDTVAVRMPSHPVAQALIEAANVPIAAPSANRSGKPSPTSATHVLADLRGKIAGVVDGGPTAEGVESTVIDCTTTPPILYRPGGVTREQLEAVLGPIRIDPALLGTDEQPKSPGMKYTHYAPEGELTLVENQAAIQTFVDKWREKQFKVGIMATDEHKQDYDADVILSVGSRNDLAEVAHNLYHVLRQFDEQKVDVIIGETFPREGIGVAIMNRLEKAAGGRIIQR